MREIYETVLKAQAAAIAAVRPGVKTGEVDAVARKVIADAGYGDYFTHSVGHGLGMQVHEAPLMRPGLLPIRRCAVLRTARHLPQRCQGRTAKEISGRRLREKGPASAFSSVT